MTAAAGLFLLHRFVRPLSVRTAVALASLPLLFTGKALFTARVFAPIDLPYAADPLKSIARASGISRFHNGTLSDLYCQIIPWRKAVRYAYAHNEWPLWNPFSFAGDILAGSAQPAPYHPINLISFLLPFDLSWSYLAAATFLVAAIGAFAFSRELGCSELPSLIAAAIWMFSNVISFWLEWPIGLTTAFVPLILTAVRSIARRPGLPSAAFLMTSLVLIVLAGHPETAFHAIALGSVYGALEIIANRSRLSAVAGYTLLAGAAAFGIAAMYTLPILEALPQTREHHFRMKYMATRPHSVEAVEAVHRLLPNFLPFIYGFVDREEADVPVEWKFYANGYSGSLAFALAAIGLLKSRRRSRWFFGALFGAGLLLGSSMPGLIDVIGKLPLFNVALNERFIFLVPLSLGILAAFGAEKLLDLKRSQSLALFILPLGGFALLTALEHDAMIARGLSSYFLGRQTLLMLAPLLVAALLVFALRRQRLLGGLLLVVCLQRFFEPAGSFYPTLPRRAFYPALPGFEKLEKSAEPYRIVGLFYTLIPGTAALYELEDVRSYQAMTNTRLVETMHIWSVEQPVWYNRVEYLASPFLKSMNVRYAIATPTDAVPDGWKLIDERPGLRIFETDDFIHRSFIPASVVMNAADLPLQMSGDGDLRAQSWINDGNAAIQGPMTNGRGIVVTRREGLGLRLRARLESDAWIVITQTAWKGWRAFSGKTELPLHHANHAFLALKLPAGTHEVKLIYRPASFVLGGWITATTLVTVLIVAIAARRRRAGTSLEELVHERKEVE